MADVRRLWIPGPEGRLEAALRVAEQPRAAVVLAHPHPLHGGTLHNPVVFHADRELNARGATTLRFNFRGVGESDGSHDAGRGELEDLAAAVSWTRGLAPSAPLILVGYSFGAWCAVRLAERDPAIRAVAALGLPLDVYPFPSLTRLARPIVVVQGGADELGSPEQVRALLEQASPPGILHVVEGASHRFPGLAREAAQRLGEALAELLPELRSSAHGPPP